MGHLWAAFSPLSGETTLLNDEGAAVLEVLGTQWMSQAQVCAQLAEDTGQVTVDLASIVGDCWPRLIESGLVQRAGDVFGATASGT